MIEFDYDRSVPLPTRIDAFRRDYVHGETVPSEENRTRLDILFASLEIAAAEGVRGASLRRISSRLNMRTATLYTHFPGGKDELIGEALVTLLRIFYGNVASGLRADDTSVENLRTLVFSHVKHMLSYSKEAPAWDVIIAADQVTPVLTDEIRASVTVMLGGYRALLCTLLEDCGILPHESARWAEFLISVCDGVTSWAGSGNQVERQHSHAEEFAWLAIRRMLSIDR